MPRIAAPKPEQVPAESKPTLDAFTKNIGFTPNMMAAFAQSPIAFNAWATLLGSLSKALDVKTRDSIGLAVSEVNGCNYCLTVHADLKAVRDAGYTDANVMEIVALVAMYSLTNFFNNVFDPEKDFPAVTPAGSI
jgi:AhpD family alkylhydroperoxidase